MPANVELAQAELYDTAAFGASLGAEVPLNWPPETLADALPLFLSQLQDHPHFEGWLGWYAVAKMEGQDVLVGSVGFTGPPGEDGSVEMGYSVLPHFQRRGYATEMAGALLDWARGQGVRGATAQTTDDNAGSRGVLAKLRFTMEGPGHEPGHQLYRLIF